MIPFKGSIKGTFEHIVKWRDKSLATFILGKGNFFSDDAVEKKWHSTYRSNAPIPYSVESLKWAARQNQTRKAKYRLVYVLGMSFKRQIEILGTNVKKQPCFFNSALLERLNAEQPEWFTSSGQPGYRLFNFQIRMQKSTQKDQERTLSHSLSHEIHRSHGRSVSEALFSIFMITGERLLAREFHCGEVLPHSEGYLRLGYNDEQGLLITLFPFDIPRSDCGVVLCRKYSYEQKK